MLFKHCKSYGQSLPLPRAVYVIPGIVDKDALLSRMKDSVTVHMHSQLDLECNEECFIYEPPTN